MSDDQLFADFEDETPDEVADLITNETPGADHVEGF